MKKFLALMLALVMALALVACGQQKEPDVQEPQGPTDTDEVTYKVAMITDYGDITDQSFNQTTYEACKAFCEANGVDFNYFKPTGDSDAERIAQVEAAIDEGYNVIVMPGYLFAATIGECQPTYPDVKFIALDVSEYDLTSNGVDLSKASNLFSAVYQEELSGYMAGYAAVKMGYKKLGFLGGMELPGAAEFVRKASKQCTVSIAHTDASYDDAVCAIEAGVTHLTHLYNAMPGIHHRKPGVIPAAVENEQVSAELISDGQHVHPASVRLAFRMFGPARMVLISDSLRCCGMPDGEYELGGQPVFLQGGVARLSDGTIAGSATNVYDCMLRAISFGIPREDAVRAATYNPARQLGCLDEAGSIRDGKQADFVICDAELNRREVWLAGEKLA